MASNRPIPSFLIFQDRDDRWRWNFLGPNGRIVARGTESYLKQQGCIRAIGMCMGSASAPVLVRQRVAAGADSSSQGAIAQGGDGGGDDMLDLTQAQIV